MIIKTTYTKFLAFDDIVEVKSNMAKQNLNMPKLANKLGITKSYIYQILNMEKPITDRLIVQFMILGLLTIKEEEYQYIDNYQDLYNELVDYKES